MTTDTKPLFKLGEIVATPSAIARLGSPFNMLLALLSRHVRGDWGSWITRMLRKT